MAGHEESMRPWLRLPRVGPHPERVFRDELSRTLRDQWCRPRLRDQSDLHGEHRIPKISFYRPTIT